MIPFKSHFHKGFSFIEAVISLAIIAMSITALMTLQQTVFRRITFNTFKIERLHYLQNMFLIPFIENQPDKNSPDANNKEKRIEKTYTNPDTQVVYERLPINSGSSLARFKGLYQERITGTWVENEKKRIADLYRYSFEFPEEKE